MVTIFCLLANGLLLTGIVMPSDISGYGGIPLVYGPNQVPSDAWTAWKNNVGIPSGLLNIVVSGP